MSGARLGTASARLACAVFSDVVGRVAPADSTSKNVFITIDDGPSDGSSDILDTLGEFDAPATWFLTGENVLAKPDQAKRIMEAGHDIGNHSSSHVDSWRIGRESAESDLERGIREIEQTIGITCRLTRPPYGRMRPSLRNWAHKSKQTLVLWDVMVDDFGLQVDPDRVVASISQRTRRGSIVVFHDHGLAGQHAAIQKSLRWLADEGWSFARLRI